MHISIHKPVHVRTGTLKQAHTYTHMYRPVSKDHDPVATDVAELLQPAPKVHLHVVAISSTAQRGIARILFQ